MDSAASNPFKPGMDTSSRTTSGFDWTASCTASIPSTARPASAPFQVGEVDAVGELVVEEAAPKEVVGDVESRKIRIHRAKNSQCEIGSRVALSVRRELAQVVSC